VIVASSEPLREFVLSQRLKHYSAASGVVYQYVFRGKLPGDAGEAHVFEVTADRQAAFPVRVVIGSEELHFCEQRLGSGLRWNDEYALAKLALFHAFDEREKAEEMRESVRPGTSELLGYMKTLRMLDDDTSHNASDNA
jgi:hypothetical protein